MNKKLLLIALLGCMTSASITHAVYSKGFDAVFACIKRKQYNDLSKILKSGIFDFTLNEWNKMLWIAHGDTNLLDIIYAANPASVMTQHDDTYLLHMAVNAGKAQFVKWLLRNGGGDNGVIDMKHHTAGETCLHRALFKGHFDCAWLLLFYGARIDVPSAEGKTVHGLYPHLFDPFKSHKTNSLYSIWQAGYANILAKQRSAC